MPSGDSGYPPAPPVKMRCVARGHNEVLDQYSKLPSGAHVFVLPESVYAALNADGLMVIAPTQEEATSAVGGSPKYSYRFAGMTGGWYNYRNDIKQVRVIGGVLPSSTHSWFSQCLNLESVDLSGLDASYVSDMGYMFYYCIKLTSLDLSSINTSNVLDMTSIIKDCRNLKSLTTGDGWIVPEDESKRLKLPVAMDCVSAGHDDGPYEANAAVPSGAHNFTIPSA